VLIPKEKPPITVVGDVGGRIAIIVVRRVFGYKVWERKERRKMAGEAEW